MRLQTTATKGTFFSTVVFIIIIGRGKKQEKKQQTSKVFISLVLLTFNNHLRQDPSISILDRNPHATSTLSSILLDELTDCTNSRVCRISESIAISYYREQEFSRYGPKH